MADFLPLFPLQIVVFPGEDLNLHIFEPRYKQLLGECETQGTTFGIPAFIDGEVQSIGTEVELISIEKRYANGELDVKTKGVAPFRILQFYRQAPEKLYAGANIERLEYPEAEGDYLLSEQILELAQELFSLLNIEKSLPEDPKEVETFNIGHHVGFSVEQEYQLLGISEEKERQQFTLEHLENLLPTVRQMDNLRKRAQMNGHFKNIIPPEL